ncbi:MAG: hypothetical protein ABH857_05475 [Elusimicrobiota bacterium]
MDLSPVSGRALWKKILEIVGGYVLFITLFAVFFYFLWIPMPDPKIFFFIVDIAFVFLYLFIFTKYANWIIGKDDVCVRNYYMRNHFAIYFTFTFFAYIGTPPNNPPFDYNKSLMAHIWVLTLVLMIVYIVKYKRSVKQLEGK